MNLYLIGLTGNIACGKSTVLDLLREHGAHVLDADAVTRELQQPGQPVYAQIVATFGDHMLLEPGGALDRAKLGTLVFNDPAALRQLEQIVHPAVRERIEAWLEDIKNQPASNLQSAICNLQSAIAVLDAIKLLEGGWKHIVNAVWVVTCTPEQQLERLQTTRGMSEADARTRIAAQPPQADKVAQATVVIDNSGTLEQTRAQVDAAWQAITEQAA